MRITIGVQNVARELNVELDDSTGGATDPAAVAAQVSEAVATEDGVLDLTDAKGNRIIVPARSLAYVHVGVDEQRFIGFSA
ncbi:DUF3107 domain-containing protein [Pseudactinotalea sp. HY158]|uniref:DUF3107 domain-containing protein n=1 Tax=unclassified Pseudactinotalea TaxID=2649176 RepID=UPI00129CF3A4|nr:DUF3107 domain-containing protein [Pseudactinotalea sp. HY158]MPV51079.1 DUF3107 family protein [Pseudactinotalea sp. HY160]QGH70278.1 DUF3107 family protein [Pseudactinotalea sp. HY158]